MLRLLFVRSDVFPYVYCMYVDGFDGGSGGDDVRTAYRDVEVEIF